MADDDTRYRIVTRKRPTTRRPTSPVGPVATPAVPLAAGTAQAAERLRRPPSPPREEPVTLPRRFGGVEIVVEDHGDHIAVVLPGALRLLGTRDEAVALAAALLHTVERTR